MSFRIHLGLVVALSLVASLAPLYARAQSDQDTTPEKHGRKYKAPPDTAHIEVTVTKNSNNKPIVNAAVIFHPIKDGVDSGTLEVKSDPDGKAIIDVIPVGSQVRVQVIANGFATYAQDFTVDQPSRTILVKMLKPRAQISAYVNNEGKPAQMKPGLQEPVRPKEAAPNPSTTPPASTGAPPSSAPSTPPASNPQR